MADIDPASIDQFGKPVRRDAHRGRSGTCGRVDHIEIAQRDVAIDGEGARKPERADAPDRMAGQGFRLVRSEHPRPSAKSVLGLAVVEPGVAPRAHKQTLVLRSEEHTSELKSL